MKSTFVKALCFASALIAGGSQSYAASALGAEGVIGLLNNPQVSVHLQDKLIERISVSSVGEARMEKHTFTLDLQQIKSGQAASVPCTMTVILESIYTVEGVDHVMQSPSVVCNQRPASGARGRPQR